MLAFTPVPVHMSPYARRAPAPALYEDLEYFDVVAERAAQEYAAATARVQAIEQRRAQAQRQRYLEEASRRQAALDNYYREQSRLIATSVRAQVYAPARSTSSCGIEELACGVRREEERRRALLACQREMQQARALAEARQREEAERRLRARAQAQRAREEEMVLAFLGLSAAASQGPSVPSQQSRIPIHHRRAPIPTRAPAQETTLDEAQEVPEDELYAALQGYLSQLTQTAPAESPKPEDRKGKGKAVDVPPSVPAPAPASAPKQPEHVPSFKEELETRMRNETDPEVQEALVKLYSDIFDDFHPRGTQPVAGPSTRTRDTQPESAPSSSAPKPQSKPATPEPTQPTSTEGADLHRTPALPPAVAEKLLKFYHARRARKLSLEQIAAVESALRALQSAFEFPAHLDFVHPSGAGTPTTEEADEPGALAYTANNTPVHTYEHALNGLLTQLDAVESNGDLAVRGRRKEVVREVERALEAIERRVEESRERERERSRERRRSAASSPAPSVSASDVEDDVTVKGEVKADTPVEATPVSEVHNEVPDADTVSVALVDIPASEDSASSTPAELAPTSPIAAPEADTVSEAPVDVPSPASDSVVVSPVDSTPSSFSVDIVEAPEADPVSVELVDVVPSATSDSPAEAPVAESTTDAPTEPTSPASPSEPSDATFTTAPSTIPSTSVPMPEAITRATSSATDATFATAQEEPSAPSTSDAAPEPETMTRVPSETPSTGEETFLLSSTPLADAPKRKYQQPRVEEDELEVISKEEAEAKSDSEWSDVDASA